MCISIHLSWGSLAAVCGAGLMSVAVARAEVEARFHDAALAALQARDLEAENVDAVFDFIWSRLPGEVRVFPTENYVYWQLATGGRELRGNLRLSPGEREQGRLLFAYSEWQEFPADAADRAARLKHSAVYPVLSPGADAFEWVGTHRGKTVRFLLNRLVQRPPRLFALAEGERLVQRTADESGLRFFLLFDEKARVFRWLLDEEDEQGTAPEHWRELATGIVQGRRTGFVFRVEGARKTLAAVRALSVERNDYHDGPFDQLADNDAEATPLRECLILSDSALEGKIDAWGRYTDARRPARVAIAPYATYHTTAEAIRAAAAPAR